MTVQRQAIRAIILSPQNEILLIRIRRPDGVQGFWVAPGGGVEPGETRGEALRRELSEELGLSDFAIGPLVWRRHHTFTWNGRRLSQKEEYHIVHADRFMPVMNDPVEALTVDRFHWWAIADLETVAEPLTPLSLPKIVRGYLGQGAPRGPLVEEVISD